MNKKEGNQFFDYKLEAEPLSVQLHIQKNIITQLGRSIKTMDDTYPDHFVDSFDNLNSIFKIALFKSRRLAESNPQLRFILECSTLYRSNDINELYGNYHEITRNSKTYLDELRNLIQKINGIEKLYAFKNITVGENIQNFLNLFILENNKIADRVKANKLALEEYVSQIPNDEEWIKEQMEREDYISSKLGPDLKNIKREEITSEKLHLNTLAGLLEINTNGDIKLGAVVTNINPIRDEFKILIKLVKNQGQIVTYEELGFKLKTEKMNLTSKIKMLKKMLKILPSKEAINKDIIVNRKGLGYIIEKP